MRADRSHKFMAFMVRLTELILNTKNTLLILNVHSFFFFPDECQTKYGNANAWRYCTKVFDMLTVAAVSMRVL